MLVRWHRSTLSLCLAFVLVLILLSYVSNYNYEGRYLRLNSLGKLLPLADSGKRPFRQILVHLDLKGAPLKAHVYEWLFPLLKSLNVNGVVIEYEDMLPYSSYLAQVSRIDHYTVDEILRINQLAYENDLELIPLIQTFGHMEFILKEDHFSSLRENPAFPDTICPSDKKSQDLIKEMIRQVRTLHPNSSRVHIGADEAYHVAEDLRCRKVIAGMLDKGVNEERGPEIIKLMHLTRVVKMVKSLGFTEVFAWNDMFDKIPVDLLRSYGLANTVTPVVWGYIEDVTKEGYFPGGLFERLDETFDSLWFASAYKGGNGISETFINVQRYLENHKSYVKLYRQNQKYLSALKGIVMTGWQRYNHNAKLCELFMISLPSLLTNIAFLRDIEAGSTQWEKIVRKNLNCSNGLELIEPMLYKNFSYYPLKETTYSHCDFYGKQLYKLIMNDLRFLTWKARRASEETEKQVVRQEMNTLMAEMKKRSDFNDDTESLIVSRSHSKVDTARASSDAEIDDDDEDRRIHSNSSPFNSIPHVFNLANCIIGVSILAMPFVFQQCGILLAVVMIMFCSILTKFTCHFLVKAAFLSRMRSYESLALAAIGKSGRRMTEISMLCFLMSSVIAFLVVIGDLGPHIAADYLELEAPTQRLRVLIMIFEAIPSLIEGKWSVHVVWWRSEGFLSCLPIVCMAMSCQTQLFCVIDCIKDASTSKVDTVVNNAINFCSAMYAAVGLFGYVAFYYKELHGDVLVELEPTIFTQLLKLCFMLSIAFSIPLMLFPLRIAIFNLLLRPSGCELPAVSLHNSTFHILTVIILFCNAIVAIMIPNVEFILGLTGSLIGSIVSTILPCIIFICIGGRRGHSSLPYAKICLIIGIFMLLMSTWATLQSDKKSNVVEKPKPKDSIVDHPDLESLERLEEKVLDSNMNISQKLNDIAGLAAKGQQKEAERLIVEMKEQQKEQQELIKKQEKIVENLNKHMERHKLENDKTTNTTPKLQPAEEKKEEPKTEQKVENPNPEIPVAQKVEAAEKSPMQEVPKTENEKQNEV